ncbi:hypothetical protein BRADI_5g05137v3 [Brachypodium distachyon]|uniref:DUF4283 domain-containing protein n=1 Tax=Brachypodium distachyon TaxID=15368 RepID=A0A2K2CFJ9_BRADI|nr:hypothetical protein BRADI_5g05137v3 [Brachypodium distachyon]
MTMYRVADEELLMFEMPLTSSFRTKLDSGRVGMVTISGGSLSLDEMVSLLQLFVPTENFIWDVTLAEKDVFKVHFPNKAELQRMVCFGNFKVPGSPCLLTFEEWTVKVKPVWTLQDVWVLVSGIPTEVLRDFLGLWGLGSLFGVTKEVDMVYTRLHNVLRIRIACADYKRIPARRFVLIKGEGFELFFQVEAPLEVQQPADATMPDVSDSDGDGNNDNGNSSHEESDGSGKHTTNSDAAVPSGRWADMVEEDELAASAPPFAAGDDESVVIEDDQSDRWV